MKKRILSVLLTLVMLFAATTVFAVPASAEEFAFPEGSYGAALVKRHDGTVVKDRVFLQSTDDLQKVLNECSVNDDEGFVCLELNGIWVTEKTITIPEDRMLYVMNYAHVANLGKRCSIKSNDGGSIFIMENGSSLKLDQTIDIQPGGVAREDLYSDLKRATIIVNGDHCLLTGAFFANENGAVGRSLYVDGEHCTVSNCIFEGAHDEIGSAAYMNEDYFRMEYCKFIDCYSQDEGSAVYVSPGVDDSYIEQCCFINNGNNKQLSDINGRSDTYVIACRGENAGSPYCIGCTPKKSGNYYEFGPNGTYGATGIGAAAYLPNGNYDASTQKTIHTIAELNEFIRVYTEMKDPVSGQKAYDHINVDLAGGTFALTSPMELNMPEGAKVYMYNGTLINTKWKSSENSMLHIVSEKGKVTLDFGNTVLYNMSAWKNILAIDCPDSTFNGGCFVEIVELLYWKCNGIYIGDNSANTTLSGMEIVAIDTSIASAASNTLVKDCKMTNCNGCSMTGAGYKFSNCVEFINVSNINRISVEVTSQGGEKTDAYAFSTIDILFSFISELPDGTSVKADFSGRTYTPDYSLELKQKNIAVTFTNGVIDGSNIRNDAPVIQLTGEGGILLELDNTTLCSAKNSAIRIDAPTCTVKGGTVKDCKTEKDGGGVYIGENAAGNALQSMKFENCESGGNGGAIFTVAADTYITYCDFLNCLSGCAEYRYITPQRVWGFYHTSSDMVFSGATHTVIKNCNFRSDVTFVNERNPIVFDGTGNVVKDCEIKGYEYQRFWCYDLKNDLRYEMTLPVIRGEYSDKETDNTASVLSVDNPWIIGGVAAVVMVAVVVLAIVVKKKKPALADGSEEEKTEDKE